MPQTTMARGNELYDWLVLVPSLAWSSPTLTTATAVECTATLQGVQIGDVLASFDYVPAAGTSITAAGGLPYGVSANNFRVSANNTIAVLWSNSTAGTVTLPTGPFYVNLVRPESYSNLPQSAV